MGREVLPQDKDYILDILDDVFFYIKQGSNSFLTKNLSLTVKTFHMTNSLWSLNHFSFPASKVSQKIYLVISSKDSAASFLKILIQLSC